MKKDIRDTTLEELKGQMTEILEPAYRANQIFCWLYKKGVADFGNMDNLPKLLKDRLKVLYTIRNHKLLLHLKSADGTEKFLFELLDGNFIEAVLIYAKGRKTLCLSTQVGCRYSCVFCASGLKGFVKDLNPSEIINQILTIRYAFKHRVTNFVFMGMGEPLDNYENLIRTIRIMNTTEGLRISARRITISTCGIIPAIERLKSLRLQLNLSISLHAADDKLRSSLMPVNKIYPLERLIETCDDFITSTGRIITLEYVLIKGKNDSLQDADRLSEIAKRLKAKVNLLLYNPVPGLWLEPTQKKDAAMFIDRLIKNRVKATLRKSKGIDIQAACGQLAGDVKQRRCKALA